MSPQQQMEARVLASFAKGKQREREREREHAVSLSACGLSLGLPFVLHVISIFSRDAETFRMCLLS